MELTLTNQNRVGKIDHKSGSSKTVCVGTVLNYFGIPQTAYKFTWNGTSNVWDNVLRRGGYAVRSRRSSLPKKCTVGGARNYIAKISSNDPAGTKYIITVSGHILLLDGNGDTIIDTAPRKRDRRQVIKVRAVFPN